MKQAAQELLTDANLKEVARFMGVLSELARLRLLSALMVKPLTVSELVAQTGMRQGNVSKHLGILLNNNIVCRTQEGNFARYFLVDGAIEQLCRVVCQRLKAGGGHRADGPRGE